MERELLITGMGGQGVQLAAQVIARGATLEGRHVMLFGVYGGAMRGMNTDGTVVVGDVAAREVARRGAKLPVRRHVDGPYLGRDFPRPLGLE